MNDTGITVLKAANDDSQYGRDADPNKNDNADGHKGFSFATLTGGCVQDNVTGLTWSPDQGDPVLWSGTDEIKTTANSGSGLCNKTDWRLPTVKELVSIVSYHTTAPAIDTGVFSDTPATAIYWTDSHNAATPAQSENNSMQWVVNFQFGNADNTSFTDNLTTRRVRLVRP